jgi:glycine hydroxymethyltransferase
MDEETLLAAFVRAGVEHLYAEDPALSGILEEEYRRQAETLVLVASCTPVDPSVLACEAMVPANVTAEGYPGRRYHAGCRVVDRIEQLAIDRAKEAFGARYANVQPHSATTANYAVLSRLLRPGDRLLGLRLDFGGHLTHGAKAAFSGTWFESHGYGLDAEGRIDYGQAERLAHEIRPQLIVCGATAYPRQVDFARFRAIADAVGAWLLADISHIAGLVATGLHPSPIDHAHITTTCTHKQLYGPRGGLILCGRDADAPAPDGRQTLAELMQQAVFPFFQGAPFLNTIAAKARALARVATPELRRLMERVLADSRALAGGLLSQGWRVLSGGSDNHLVLFDVAARGLTGLIAEEALEEAGIVVNKNPVPGDPRPPRVASGIRLGTNTIALRGMGPEEAARAARLIHRVLSAVEPRGDREYHLAPAVRDEVRAEVADLCRRFPIPRYPLRPAAVPA